jgi:predicted amidophosphoribosyltransferase
MGQAMAAAVSQPATPPAVTSCARCQARLDRASKFCPECGAALA